MAGKILKHEKSISTECKTYEPPREDDRNEDEDGENLATEDID
jgi:hypothetical protein